MKQLQIQQIPFGSTSLKYHKLITNPYNKDIIPGVYEGGYKLWECTLDFLKFLSENNIGFAGKRVMDIGCGHGLLGIAAMKSGASFCCFQDYNKQVLDKLTIANVTINQIPLQRCRFVEGDWDSVHQRCGQKYDIILGSQIIYKEQNYQKIIKVIRKNIEKDGKAIVANKCFYFGVGGNMDDFIDKIEGNGMKYVSLCKLVPAKGGNKKEIGQIRI